ncbi:MAG: DUF6266 family protein [Ginsengibacter sp.]
MGTIQKGILGGFSGKVGNVIGGSWKGIDYMRSVSSRKNATTTQKQKEQQMKFALIARFQQPLTNLLSRTFRSFAIKMTGANSAMSYNLRNAITGSYPNFAINYSRILISRGDMPNAINPAVETVSDGMVVFTWVNNTGTGKSKDSDRSILVAYCPEMQHFIYTDEGASREEEEAQLDLFAYTGKEVQTWVAFISEDGKEVATSIYTWAITIL